MKNELACDNCGYGEPPADLQVISLDPSRVLCIPCFRAALVKTEAKLEEVKRERDEARREVCEFKAEYNIDPSVPEKWPKDVATEHGWNCFDDPRPTLPDPTDGPTEEGGGRP